MSPGTVPWAAVPKAQRDRLTEAIVGTENYEIDQKNPGSGFMTLDREPLEILANGVGSGAGPIGPAFAGAIVGRERHDGLPNKLPDAFLSRRIVDFGLQIEISPTLTWHKSGSYGEFDLSQRPAPLDALPEPFRKKLGVALEQRRKQQGSPGARSALERADAFSLAILL